MNYIIESEEEKRGAEKAWKLAGEIIKHPDDGGMDDASLDECFGTDDIYEILNYSYSDIARKYAKWKKKQDEINFGGEVVFTDDGMRGVLLGKADDVFDMWFVFTEEGRVVEEPEKLITRTGRHFQDIAELLKKLRGSKNEQN